MCGIAADISLCMLPVLIKYAKTGLYLTGILPTRNKPVHFHVLFMMFYIHKCICLLELSINVTRQLQLHISLSKKVQGNVVVVNVDMKVMQLGLITVDV